MLRMRKLKQLFKKPLFQKTWFRYLLGILLCMIYIIGGHALLGGKMNRLVTIGDSTRCKAKVTEIVTREEIGGEGTPSDVIQITFRCSVQNGSHKGETAEVIQKVDKTSLTVEKPVAVGDSVFLQVYEGSNGASWTFSAYNRTGIIVALVCLLIVMLLALGRLQGLKTVLSLIFTALAVFCVFIPAIMSGGNVYLLTLTTCIFIIVMTLFMVYGVNKKSMIAGAACGIGVLISLVIVCTVQKIVHLSGYGVLSDDAVIYMLYDLDIRLDLQAVIFSVIVIGAIGAIMDIALSIVTSLEEMSIHARRTSEKRIWKSGLKIGRDMMGTMSNTLILAYIGSSLMTVLVLITSYGSIVRIINTEAVVIEIMSAVIGSMGIICTIPAASYLCAKCYHKVGRKTAEGSKSIGGNDEI